MAYRVSRREQYEKAIEDNFKSSLTTTTSLALPNLIAKVKLSNPRRISIVEVDGQKILKVVHRDYTVQNIVIDDVSDGYTDGYAVLPSGELAVQPRARSLSPIRYTKMRPSLPQVIDYRYGNAIPSIKTDYSYEKSSSANDKYSSTHTRVPNYAVLPSGEFMVQPRHRSLSPIRYPTMRPSLPQVMDYGAYNLSPYRYATAIPSMKTDYSYEKSSSTNDDYSFSQTHFPSYVNGSTVLQRPYPGTYLEPDMDLYPTNPYLDDYYYRPSSTTAKGLPRYSFF